MPECNFHRWLQGGSLTTCTFVAKSIEEIIANVTPCVLGIYQTMKIICLLPVIKNKLQLKKQNTYMLNSDDSWYHYKWMYLYFQIYFKWGPLFDWCQMEAHNCWSGFNVFVCVLCEWFMVPCFIYWYVHSLCLCYLYINTVWKQCHTTRMLMYLINFQINRCVQHAWYSEVRFFNKLPGITCSACMYVQDMCQFHKKKTFNKTCYTQH